MRYAIAGLICFACSSLATHAYAQVKPEVEACRVSGLAALKEESPSIENLTFDIDGLSIAKADTKVEDTPIKMVIMGEANLQRVKNAKPNRFVCLIGEKGKVVLTFFTER